METLSLQDVLVKEFTKEVEFRPKLNKMIKNNYSKLSLDQIIEIQESSNDPIVQKFLSALLLTKLEEEAPKGSQYFKFLNNGLFLLEAASEYKHAIVKCCDSILIKELNKCKELDENMLLLSYSKNIKEKSEIEMKGFKQNELEILASLWKKAGEICDSDDTNLLVKTLENIKHVQNESKLSDLDTLTIALQTTSITHIENKISIDSQISKKDIEEFHSILNLLDDLRSNDETYFSEIKEARQLFAYKEVCSMNQIDYTRFSEDIINYIDPSIIQFLDIPLYAMRGTYFQVCIYKAIYNYEDVAVKMYSPVHPQADWEPIFNEIRIYQKLSAIANNGNCFLKYYGTIQGNGSIYMVMEYCSDNLMTHLSKLKFQNYRFDELLIGNIFYKLITSFAIMKDLGIFHGDIKPHNFLVDHYWNIKIIDFSVSTAKNGETAMIFTGNFPIQGTKGYLSPELEEALNKGNKTMSYNPEKSDVFSLGLVFLQMLTLEALEDLNKFEKNEKLFEIIGNVPFGWARSLLSKMLAANPSQRSKFKELIEYVVVSNTIVN